LKKKYLETFKNRQPSTVNRQPPTANDQPARAGPTVKKMILLIDTSQETGTVALSKEGRVLFSEENKVAKEHAIWLHTAIARLLSEAKITMRELEAVSVVAGPGSYTGLRVGMAAAKGLCFALKIPLITQNTLRVMAESMRSFAGEKSAMICPMIDARRDEVFTALYDGMELRAEGLGLKAEGLTQNAKSETVKGQRSTVVRDQRSTVNDLIEVLPPQAMILDKNSFETNLSCGSVIFFGSGAEKWKKITSSSNAFFEAQPNITQAFVTLTTRDFQSKNWADTIYSEPVYLKEFFTY
jgi:tRNA threonylcarbamoyladenosine biosynthesis protein TsaB